MQAGKMVKIFVVTMLVMSLLTGCYGKKEAMTVNADGTCTYKVTYLYSKELYDESKNSGSDNSSSKQPLETGDFVKEETSIDGKPYYSFTREFSFDSVQSMGQFLIDSDAHYNRMIQDSKDPSQYEKEDFKSPFTQLTLSNMRCVATIRKEDFLEENKEDTISSASDKSLPESYRQLGLVYEISLTLPEPITESNGTISGNTVTWTFDNLSADWKLLAGTANRPVISTDTQAPEIVGVSNGKYYRTAKNIEATDNTSVQTLTINGKNYGMAKFKLNMDGKHTLVATDANQNTTTVKFTMDTVSPVVKGAMNGKTYRKKVKLRFSDKTSGVKSVKVNKKKKNKKKVTLKKAGKYTVKVKDKAGNVTTIRFRIKKK